MNPLLTATDLVHWADQRRSQDTLPLLVRRLILASVDPIDVDFASGDSVNRPGYDGILRTVQGSILVPSGQSVWEMGVNQSPVTKANDDYSARKAGPGSVVPSETTFVFVSLRRWQGKNDWAAEKRAENFWHDVRVIDAVDLEQWFDRCPAVAAWARRHIVGTSDGLRDLDEVWELWALRTNPRLTSSVFTAGRSESVERVRNWLTGPPACLRVLADTADEAVGFIVAASSTLDEPAQERLRSRGLLVSSPDAWRSVAGLATPLVLLSTSPTLGSDSLAVARGHHVAVAYGNDSGGVPVDVQLQHLRRAELENALGQMGVPTDRARHIATESRGRIAAVVDLLGGGTVSPHWAAPASAPQLIPFFLAGSWCEIPGDREAVSRLSRVSVDEVTARLSRWANETDPPIRIVGAMWDWISRQRGWPYLCRHITAPDLSALRQVSTDVLGEDDPRLDLAPDQRWMASLHDRIPRYSDAIRKGLAGSLALIAAQPGSVRTGSDPIGVVAATVRDLFGATPEPRRWCSLASVLPLLAEAAPDIFLAAVERGPVGDAAVRTALFQEEGYFGGSRHCHLLWALEMLAWLPEYLSRVAVTLAGLTANDPGGKTGNRPAASLRTIFLPWKPCTAATVQQRLDALDAIHRVYPRVAFDLALNLLPRRLDNSSPTPRPRWRPCSLSSDARPTIADHAASVLGIFSRAMCWADGDQTRWAALISSATELPEEQIDELTQRIVALPLEQFAEGDDDGLRRAARKLLHQKRTINGIYPAITDELVSRFETIYARLEPADLIRRHAWLFAAHPDLLSVTGNDWRAEQEALGRERQQVVREFLAAGATDQLIAMAELSSDPTAVGQQIGESDLADDAVTLILADCLNADPEKQRQCALGIVWARFRRDGMDWVARTFADERVGGWPSSRKATFAYALPFETATWDWVEAWGEDTAAAYWRTRCSWVSDAHRDAPRAIRALLAWGRPFAALHIATLCLSGDGDRGAVNPTQLLDVLRAVSAVARGDATTEEGLRLNDGLGYDLSQLLTAVEQASVTTEQELAATEWTWLPVLEHTERGPAALHRALAQDAATFAQFVTFIYRPDNAQREDESAQHLDELSRARATQAFRLLHEWRGVPGRGGDGTINTNQLRDWVHAAREAFTRSGHVAVGDHRIGEVLARVPVRAEDVWPHESVRLLLEELRSDDIEQGVYLGVVNGRGVTVRSPDDGGELERGLAERYRNWASALSAYPRTANVLRQLADNYSQYAQREDERRDLNEFWG